MVKSNSHFGKGVFVIGMMIAIGVVSFSCGIFMTLKSHADETPRSAPRIIYPKRTELDFEGIKIQGELRNPGEFFFRTKKDEEFSAMIGRRKNFHKEMLRDVMLGP